MRRRYRYHHNYNPRWVSKEEERFNKNFDSHIENIKRSQHELPNILYQFDRIFDMLEANDAVIVKQPHQKL
jgi:hypothetical protein